jgi:hypothetical protein
MQASPSSSPKALILRAAIDFPRSRNDIALTNKVPVAVR